MYLSRSISSHNLTGPVLNAPQGPVTQAPNNIGLKLRLYIQPGPVLNAPQGPVTQAPNNIGLKVRLYIQPGPVQMPLRDLEHKHPII